jgi:fructose 1,6-bisphosphatase
MSSSCAPEGLYDFAVLLLNPGRYVIESVRATGRGDIAAVVPTSRLHNIAGKYTGKDDPVLLVRVQQDFPATGEILAPYASGHYVTGGMRGSHNMPLLPVRRIPGSVTSTARPVSAVPPIRFITDSLPSRPTASDRRSGIPSDTTYPARRWRFKNRDSSVPQCSR